MMRNDRMMIYSNDGPLFRKFLRNAGSALADQARLKRSTPEKDGSAY